MLFAVNNTKDGYIVEAFIRDAGGYGYWCPLRNFGSHQGDAKDFANIDCPKLTDQQIRTLAKSFDKSFIYQRISSVRFTRQTL